MEETKNGLTRRDFLSSSALGVGVLAAGLTAGSLINPREAQAAILTFPQPAVLDVARIRDLGFYWYKKGPGCGHGSARALIQGFCEASELEFGVGNAGGWADLNRNLYAWCNSGGPGGFGVLCGAIAGAVGVMNLVGRQNDVGRAVFEWYVQAPFPGNLDSLGSTFDGSALFVPGGTVNTGHGATGSGALGTAVPIPFGENRAAIATDSPLCHVSVSKWMAAAGVKHGEVDGSGRDIRSDRCAKVTGETAAEAARLYNIWSNNGLKNGVIPGWVKPAAMAGCYDCHDTNNTTWAANPPLSNRSSQTKMDCLPCHTEPVSGRK